MANDLNQCNFIGRLGRDVETRYMPDGKAVASFSLAIGWKAKDKEGVKWVNIVAFDKLAEICEKYLNKGSMVFISGRFKTEKFTDKDGVEKYAVKIIANQMQMLGGKPSQDSEEADDNQHSSRQQRNSDNVKKASNFNDIDDEIPF